MFNQLLSSSSFSRAHLRFFFSTRAPLRALRLQKGAMGYGSTAAWSSPNNRDLQAQPTQFTSNPTVHFEPTEQIAPTNPRTQTLVTSTYICSSPRAPPPFAPPPRRPNPSRRRRHGRLQPPPRLREGPGGRHGDRRPRHRPTARLQSTVTLALHLSSEWC